MMRRRVMERLNNEIRSNAENRRAMRRSMELEALTKSSDKAVLSNVMLVLLVVLAASASLFGMTLSIGTIRDFTIMTVFLYVITSLVYRNRYDRGKMRGRCDEDYKTSLSLYRRRRASLDDRGVVGHVPEFCRTYKLRELREYRADLLVDVDMEYEEYRSKYMRMTDKQIMKLELPLHVKEVLVKCNHAKPLRLTPGLILNEDGEAGRQELLGQSGRERERQDKRRQLIERAIFVLFGGMVGFSVVLDFSPEAIMRWAMRMMPIAVAIIFGDDAGYCDITVTETHFKRGQAQVIHLFDEWVVTEKGCAPPEVEAEPVEVAAEASTEE